MSVEDRIAKLRGMFKDGSSLTEALLEDRRWELENEEKGLLPPPSKHTLFIGLDMVDGSTPSPREVDIAFLDHTLKCVFDHWHFNSAADYLLPGNLCAPGFILAIDGPQGLAGSPGETMRLCERVGGVAGKTPYDFPHPNAPFSGFIVSSVQLFATLWQSTKFYLHGLRPPPAHEASLIEVYPGKAWHDLARQLQMPLTAKKQRLEGRQQRLSILDAAGVQLPSRIMPSHDQLDAALAALIAFRFGKSHITHQGAPPFWDESKQVLREGFIIYP